MTTKELSQNSVEEQANAWLVCLYSEQISDATKEDFLTWLQASKKHASVYKQVEQAWRDIPLAENIVEHESLVEHKGTVAAQSQADVEQTQTNKVVSIANRSHKKMNTLLAIAASLIITITGYTLWWPQASQTQQYATAVGELKTITLPDNSLVYLAAKSTFTSYFSANERKVNLTSGTAYFDIEPNKNKPFYVVAGASEITVIGTEFEVRKGQEHTRISVTEGVVSLSTILPSHSNTIDNPLKEMLTVGQRAFMAKNGDLIAKNNVEKNNVATWKSGRLIYLDEKLDVIVEDVNRYRSVPIIIKSDELKELTFTASFDVDKSEEMLTALQQLPNINVVREAQAIFIVSE